MEEDYTRQYLRTLEHLTVSHYLRSYLEGDYCSQEEHNQRKIREQTTAYQKQITYFANFLKYRGILGKDLPPEELATPLTPTSDFVDIAEEAATYFQQGLEMLQTSQDMPENTSPLVEYYGFLQCVKGSITLELEVKDPRFFSKHGLVLAKSNSRYISAGIKPFGVFSALLLGRITHAFKWFKEDVDRFYSSSCCLSLEEVIKNSRYQGDFVLAFIGSWMLSTLVRYRPRMWQEVQLGQKDDIIQWIREYRRREISYAIRNLLYKYEPYPSPVR